LLLGYINIKTSILSNKNTTKLQVGDPQARRLLNLEASMEVEFIERESGEWWWQMGVQNGAYSVGRRNPVIE